MSEESGGGSVSRAGLIGLSLGMAAAGAAAGIAIERLTLGRARQRARERLDAVAPFGSLRGGRAPWRRRTAPSSTSSWTAPRTRR